MEISIERSPQHWCPSAGFELTTVGSEFDTLDRSAYENDVQPTKTAEEVERELGNEYQAKLIIDDNCIPDPFVLNSGWLNEENGITSWPMLWFPIQTFSTF